MYPCRTSGTPPSSHTKDQRGGRPEISRALQIACARKWLYLWGKHKNGGIALPLSRFKREVCGLA